MTAPARALIGVAEADSPRVAAALRALGLVPEPLAATSAALARGSHAVAVLDPSALDPGAPAADLALRLAQFAAAPVLLLAPPCERRELVAWIACPAVRAIVPRDHAHSDRDLARALTALVRGPASGLSIEQASRGRSLAIGLATSAERDQTLEGLEAFLAEAGVRPRLVRAAVDATEELLTNAIYDAPTGSDGRRLYADLDRRHTVFLGERSRPALLAAVDDVEVVVGVHDPHGSLALETARAYLVKGLGGGPEQVDGKRGGAGLGLARAFSLGDRLAVHVEPGRFTEVSVGIALRGARGDLAARPTGLVLAGP